MESEIRRYPDHEALSQAAAEALRVLAEDCVKRRGIFTLALSGGKTPRRLYELLARPSPADGLPWSRTHFFWGDERCVAPDHPDSNYAMACRALLSRVAAPPGNIHRMPAESRPPEAAADAYGAALGDFFSPPRSSGFDLILLGLGSDGHTASLFPGGEALEESSRWVMAVSAPAGVTPRGRMTLTLPAINAARDAWFLASGPGKAELAESLLLRPAGAPSAYPAARVHPRERLLWWLA